MEYMHDLKDMLCEELEQIADKGELTAGSLDTIQKLTHSLKSIDTIMAMEGYSGEYGGSYEGGMNRSYRGGSYRRGMSRNGYSSRRNYRRGSRDEESEKMVEKLEKMMEKTEDQNARQAIEQAIEMIEMK